MSVINVVNEDTYRVLSRYDENHVIINYYNEPLLVTLGNIWKLI